MRTRNLKDGEIYWVEDTTVDKWRLSGYWGCAKYVKDYLNNAFIVEFNGQLVHIEPRFVKRIASTEEIRLWKKQLTRQAGKMVNKLINRK